MAAVAITTSCAASESDEAIQPVSGAFFLEEMAEFLAATDHKAWTDSIPCMHERGFELPPMPDLSSTAREREATNGLPQDADPSDGYSLGVEDGGSAEITLSPEAGAALRGNVTDSHSFVVAGGQTVDVQVSDGCLGRARVALFGGADSYFDTFETVMRLQGLAVDADVQARVDAEVIELNRRWSKCVAKNGFDFATPLDAWEHDWSAAALGDEVGAATADVACKRSLDYDAGFQRRVDAAWAKGLADNPGLVEAWATARAEVMARL